MKKMILAALMAGSVSLGACTTNDMNSPMAGDVAQGAAIGAAGGAALGAVVPGVGIIEGAAIGAGVGGLAGAVWADNNNDGYTDGYYQNGQYYAGQPQGYDPTLRRVATGALGGAALGAAAGAVIPGLGLLEGAVIGAAVGGVAGAIWADNDRDGRADGYYQNGQYYAGAPTTTPGADLCARSVGQRRARLMKPGIVHSRSPRPVGRKRPAGFAALAVTAGAALFVSAVPGASGRRRGASSSSDVRFGGSMWFPGGQPDAAYRLLDLLATSSIDGVNPRQFNIRGLQRAVRGAPGSPATDRMLSEALNRYIAAVRAVPASSEWTVVDPEVVRTPVPVATLMREAAANGTLATFVETMPWMHETYAGLRRELLVAEQRRDRAAATRLRLNLTARACCPERGRSAM